MCPNSFCRCYGEDFSKKDHIPSCPLADAVPVEEPKAPAGLVEEMKVYLDSCADIEQTEYDEIYEIISRYEAEEPLAVLADRKGYEAVNIIPPTGVVKEWDIELLRGYEDGDGVELEKTITAPTYAECEAKARSYLNGLTDAAGKGDN